MFKKNQLRLLSFVVIFAAMKVHAEVSFVDILKTLTADKKNIVTEVPELERLLKAKTLKEAQNLLQNKSATPVEKKSDINVNQVSELIRQKTVTVVIVPGVLGEFIDTRAFEEVFSRKSTFRTQWEAMASRTSDKRFDLETMNNRSESLINLVNAASIDDENGRPLMKLVILKTIMGSMESVGSNVEKAQIFNRRLQTYVNLSQDQNIVLLGYSRGTPLALEMLSQAQTSSLSYLRSVKALVSYAGVVSGSSLADATSDQKTESGAQIAAVRKFRDELQTSENVWDRPLKTKQNTEALARFVFAIAKTTQFDAREFLNNARAGDAKTIAALIIKMAKDELGFSNILDFNGHVNRVKRFITEVSTAVDGLKSANMEQWWKTHALPRNIQYLSIAASMVDPQNSSTDKAIYDSREGYSDSLDDKSLIGNMRTYTKITGVSLNDSQVALYQTLFLPEVIVNLNPQNANLNIKSLGILQTHHWGVSLQVVNKMKDGRLNPFPREKVLLSLAAYLNQ